MKLKIAFGIFFILGMMLLCFYGSEIWSYIKNSDVIRYFFVWDSIKTQSRFNEDDLREYLKNKKKEVLKKK